VTASDDTTTVVVSSGRAPTLTGTNLFLFSTYMYVDVKLHTLWLAELDETTVAKWL